MENNYCEYYGKECVPAYCGLLKDDCTAETCKHRRAVDGSMVEWLIIQDHRRERCCNWDDEEMVCTAYGDKREECNMDDSCNQFFSENRK